MTRSRSPEIALETASAADLHALIPRPQQSRQAAGIDPEALAEMQRHADRVAAEAPPFSASVRERVRALLTAAVGMHRSNAGPCDSCAAITDDGEGQPGGANLRLEGSVQPGVRRAS